MGFYLNKVKIMAALFSCKKTEEEIDSLIALENNLKKENSGYHYSSILQSAEAILTETLKLQQDIAPDDDIIANAIDINKQFLNHIESTSSKHKTMHIRVSRVGKSIDKNFLNNCSKVNIQEILTDKPKHKLLDMAMCEHFFRNGNPAVAESLISEANLSIDPTWKSSFTEINTIVDSLKLKNVDAALSRAVKEREHLNKNNSQLEFKLHRLKFLSIVKRGSVCRKQAIAYLKNFEIFASQHNYEIQNLMGGLLFMVSGRTNPRYSALFSDDLWHDVCRTFAWDACKIMGLSAQSPLMASFTAGCQALPALLSVKAVIQQMTTTKVLTNSDELPVEIALDDSQRYHSVFSCPILKMQSTDSNPPIRLTCGHVISQEALSKLVTGTKVKCPYCPTELLYTQAKKVYL